MKKYITSLLLSSLIYSTISAAPGIGLSPYASGFTGAISDIAHTNDGRLFITEQMGFIRIIRADGSVVARPFLNIHGKVTPNVIDSVKEQGLLGLAFSPSYATDGYFYVHYTNKTGLGNVVIARYKVSADPDSADVASEQILLNVHKPFPNHNGGCIKFGPDGFLYIGIGDGGSGETPVTARRTSIRCKGRSCASMFQEVGRIRFLLPILMQEEAAQDRRYGLTAFVIPGSLVSTG